jgi:molybdate transport system permease protein
VRRGPAPTHHFSDAVFFLAIGALGASYLALILAFLSADFIYAKSAYPSWSSFFAIFASDEIRASIRLTFLSCTLSALLSLWVAVPLGYILSRRKGWWCALADTLVDIPIVLPPLTVGLSLLILFHLDFGGWTLERFSEQLLGQGITYHWPAVVLAQFTVAAAFATRTMRLTFDQMDRRGEEIARTLGCGHAQAFVWVAFPQATRGMVGALTIAWARALGEFGPVIVFAGATRGRTEVLSTSVYLELSFGDVEAAVCVSLLLVLMAAIVLLVLRLLNTESRL